jgi:hypothetical protein
VLGSFVPLSTSTNSTNTAEIYEALSDAFALPGQLIVPRESSATAVVLPNNKILLAGGSYCQVATYKGGLCGSSTFSGFQCDALQSAELYDETTQTFTLAGAGSSHRMTAARSGATANLITGSGTALDGKVLISGGSSGSTFLSLTTPPPGCGPFGQVALNSAEIYDPAADTFTATGSIPGCAAGTSPPGCTTGLPANCPGSGAPSLITTATEVGTTAVITSAANPPGIAVGKLVTVTGVSIPAYIGSFIVTAVPNGTSFRYALGVSGLGTGTGGYSAVPTQTAITALSESGTTVTATSAVGGLIVGDNVTVSGVMPAGYNGTFAVTGVGSGTFTYTGPLALGPTTSLTNAFAVANTAQCGLVDSSAALLNSGNVLVTGGDYLQFLGQSSPQAFLFNPSTATFSQTAAMNVARELPGIVKLPSGAVLVAGGLTGNAAACLSTPTTPVAFTTNSSAEVYDPTVPSWTLTSGSSSTPGAAGGMNVKRIASAELFTSGADSGLAILAGGIDADTTDGTNPNFPTCESVLNIHQTTQSETDLFDPSTTVFTPTGALHQSRGGYGFGILNSGSNSGALVVIGGECATGSLSSAAIGSSEAGTLCGSAAQTDYYELFASGSWTVGANNPSWFTPPSIASASETGTDVTITMSTANPAGLVVGGTVTIANVVPTGYNGTFLVTSIPSGTTFHYSTASGLTAGTGGTAQAAAPANAPASALLP